MDTNSEHIRSAIAVELGTLINQIDGFWAWATRQPLDLNTDNNPYVQVGANRWVAIDVITPVFARTIWDRLTADIVKCVEPRLFQVIYRIYENLRRLEWKFSHLRGMLAKGRSKQSPEMNRAVWAEIEEIYKTICTDAREAMGDINVKGKIELDACPWYTRPCGPPTVVQRPVD